MDSEAKYIDHKKEYKKDALVQLILPLTLSQEKDWQTKSSPLIKNNIKYGTIIGFHDTVEEALQIRYFWRGHMNTSYIHYKDLIVIDEIPETKVEPVLFDENNLVV